MSRPFNLSDFSKIPIIGILRGTSLKEARFISENYERCGYYALEVTMNTPDVENIISKLSLEYPKLCIGVGTICNTSDLAKAIGAGAKFIVTPTLNPDVIKKCVELQVPVFPGAFTPTEIHKAWELGATAIKVFPAGQLGPAYIKSVLAPLDSLKLIPTGGVSIDNIKDYFNVGVFGVGMGSSLLHSEYISEENHEFFSNHLLAIMNEAFKALSKEDGFS